MSRPEPPETCRDRAAFLAELLLEGRTEIYVRPLPGDRVVAWVPGGPAALCTLQLWREELALAAARGR